MGAIGQPQGWAWWPQAGESVRVLDDREVWGHGVSRVFVPSRNEVVVVSRADLRSASARPWTSDDVAWRAAAGLALHQLASQSAVATRRFDLEPLPHQLAALDRALSADHVRLLLADEVGLGKTIEAGLIYSELKARGRVRRVLVVAPKGVQLQWVAEMRERFGEEFARVGPEGVPVDVGVDPWRAFDRVVCSLDAVKPLRRRAGWSASRLVEHNERRYRALVDAGWDLVVFDEAHHVAGSSSEVARHELARSLARETANVLLLSATPHSGKTEAFARLLGLLDTGFVSGRPLEREVVAPYVVRTEKRHAVDAVGRPLFQPRTTTLEVVQFGDRDVERRLYEAVTEYVRNGYNRAKREGHTAAAFLVLLMQRLASSSTSAILAALERRADLLAASPQQLELPDLDAAGWNELTGEEQMDALLAFHQGAPRDERAEVSLLLDLARKAATAGADAKALNLLDLLRRVQREDGDPAVKAVVFTEFRPTQRMLIELLESAGLTVTAINGSMSLEERALAQDAFRNAAQVLVSTDAGGEGINLQFAHVVVNYDLPWNPMRIEQRIGRVDRIGQKHPVRAFNFVMENSVDEHVLRVLEEKLWRILAELGTDKWGDVLESAAPRVEELYAQAITAPSRFAERVAEVARETQEDVADGDSLRRLLSDDRPALQLAMPPTEDWSLIACIAFERHSGRRRDPEHMLRELPEAAVGEAMPELRGAEPGIWTLWEVTSAGQPAQRDCFALFRADSNRIRPDLAENLWRTLAAGCEVESGRPLEPDRWSDLHLVAEQHGYSAARGAEGASIWLTLRLVVRVRA